MKPDELSKILKLSREKCGAEVRVTYTKMVIREQVFTNSKGEKEVHRYETPVKIGELVCRPSKAWNNDSAGIAEKAAYGDYSVRVESGRK